VAARTVPTLPTWLAGQKITSTLMNQITTYGQFWANPPMFRMYQSIAQSVPNAVYTQITMDALDYDTDSGRAAGTPWSYTIPAGMSGRWTFNWKVGWAINATGARLESLYRNGVAVTAEQSSATNAGASRTADVAASATTIAVNAGDVMSVWAFQESTAALNTDAGQSFFEGRLVSLASP
jgi:hypothetical protein